MPRTLPATLARRFRVFRFAKRFMEVRGRAPTISETLEGLDLSVSTTTLRDDYAALRYADGLPLPLVHTSARERLAPQLPSAPVDSFMEHSGRLPGGWAYRGPQ